MFGVCLQYINSTSTNMGSLILKPYHYSSHYSNSGTVLHFLVRVPPFTSYFLRYQGEHLRNIKIVPIVIISSVSRQQL